MNHDPRFALSQELLAKQTLVEQIRALGADDVDFFCDLIEGETNLIELIGALDASILDDEILVDGAKIALEKLQGRKRAAENRIDLKRRLVAHALHQIGLKTLRTPTSTLSVAEASVKAIAIAPEEIPSRWWRAQPPKLDQEGLTRAIRARKKPSRTPRPSRTPMTANGRLRQLRPFIRRSLASPRQTAASPSRGESDHAPHIQPQ